MYTIRCRYSTCSPVSSPYLEAGASRSAFVSSRVVCRYFEVMNRASVPASVPASPPLPPTFSIRSPPPIPPGVVIRVHILRTAVCTQQQARRQAPAGLTGTCNITYRGYKEHQVRIGRLGPYRQTYRKTKRHSIQSDSSTTSVGGYTWFVLHMSISSVAALRIEIPPICLAAVAAALHCNCICALCHSLAATGKPTASALHNLRPTSFHSIPPHTKVLRQAADQLSRAITRID